MIRPILLAALLFASSAVVAAPSGKAVAILKDGDGKVIGSATAAKSDHGLRIRIKITGLLPGVHGLHIHATGKCEAPRFVTAGSHWNPDGKQHGRDNPNGSHSGDLPNLIVDARRKGTLRFDVHQADLFGIGGLMDADGSALVIHAKPDDYRTDPTGNSGDRIACGAFAFR